MNALPTSGLTAIRAAHRSVAPILALLLAASAQQGQAAAPIVFADFTGSVTDPDRGINFAGGNVGDLNVQFGRSIFEPKSPGSQQFVERFRWDFTSTPTMEVFTGRFLATLGLSDTLGTFDGAGTVVPIRFDRPPTTRCMRCCRRSSPG